MTRKAAQGKSMIMTSQEIAHINQVFRRVFEVNARKSFSGGQLTRLTRGSINLVSEATTFWLLHALQNYDSDNPEANKHLLSGESYMDNLQFIINLRLGNKIIGAGALVRSKEHRQAMIHNINDGWNTKWSEGFEMMKDSQAQAEFTQKIYNDIIEMFDGTSRISNANTDFAFAEAEEAYMEFVEREREANEKYALEIDTMFRDLFKSHTDKITFDQIIDILNGEGNFTEAEIQAAMNALTEVVKSAQGIEVNSKYNDFMVSADHIVKINQLAQHYHHSINQTTKVKAIVPIKEVFRDKRVKVGEIMGRGVDLSILGDREIKFGNHLRSDHYFTIDEATQTYTIYKIGARNNNVVVARGALHDLKFENAESKVIAIEGKQQAVDHVLQFSFESHEGTQTLEFHNVPKTHYEAIEKGEKERAANGTKGAVTTPIYEVQKVLDKRAMYNQRRKNKKRARLGEIEVDADGNELKLIDRNPLESSEGQDVIEKLLKEGAVQQLPEEANTEVQHEGRKYVYFGRDQNSERYATADAVNKLFGEKVPRKARKALERLMNLTNMYNANLVVFDSRAELHAKAKELNPGFDIAEENVQGFVNPVTNTAYVSKDMLKEGFHELGHVNFNNIKTANPMAYFAIANQVSYAVLPVSAQVDARDAGKERGYYAWAAEKYAALDYSMERLMDEAVAEFEKDLVSGKFTMTERLINDMNATLKEQEFEVAGTSGLLKNYVDQRKKFIEESLSQTLKVEGQEAKVSPMELLHQIFDLEGRFNIENNASYQEIQLSLDIVGKEAAESQEYKEWTEGSVLKGDAKEVLYVRGEGGIFSKANPDNTDGTLYVVRSKKHFNFSENQINEIKEALPDSSNLLSAIQRKDLRDYESELRELGYESYEVAGEAGASIKVFNPSDYRDVSSNHFDVMSMTTTERRDQANASANGGFMSWFNGSKLLNKLGMPKMFFKSNIDANKPEDYNGSTFWEKPKITNEAGEIFYSDKKSAEQPFDNRFTKDEARELEKAIEESYSFTEGVYIRSEHPFDGSKANLEVISEISQKALDNGIITRSERMELEDGLIKNNESATRKVAEVLSELGFDSSKVSTSSGEGIVTLKNNMAGTRDGKTPLQLSFINEESAFRISKIRKGLWDAQRLEKEGVDFIDIANSTGWYKYADGNWRYLAENSAEWHKHFVDPKLLGVKEWSFKSLSDITMKTVKTNNPQKDGTKVPGVNKKYVYVGDVLNPIEEIRLKEIKDEMARKVSLEEPISEELFAEFYDLNRRASEDWRVSDFFYNPIFMTAYPHSYDTRFSIERLRATILGESGPGMIRLSNKLGDGTSENALWGVMTHEMQHQGDIINNVQDGSNEKQSKNQIARYIDFLNSFERLSSTKVKDLRTRLTESIKSILTTEVKVWSKLNGEGSNENSIDAWTNLALSKQPSTYTELFDGLFDAYQKDLKNNTASPNNSVWIKSKVQEVINFMVRKPGSTDTYVITDELKKKVDQKIEEAFQNPKEGSKILQEVMDELGTVMPYPRVVGIHSFQKMVRSGLYNGLSGGTSKATWDELGDYTDHLQAVKRHEDLLNRTDIRPQGGLKLNSRTQELGFGEVNKATAGLKLYTLMFGEMTARMVQSYAAERMRNEAAVRRSKGLSEIDYSYTPISERQKIEHVQLEKLEGQAKQEDYITSWQSSYKRQHGAKYGDVRFKGTNTFLNSEGIFDIINSFEKKSWSEQLSNSGLRPNKPFVKLGAANTLESKSFTNTDIAHIDGKNSYGQATTVSAETEASIDMVELIESAQVLANVEGKTQIVTASTPDVEKPNGIGVLYNQAVDPKEVARVAQELGAKVDVRSVEGKTLLQINELPKETDLEALDMVLGGSDKALGSEYDFIPLKIENAEVNPTTKGEGLVPQGQGSVKTNQSNRIAAREVREKRVSNEQQSKQDNLQLSFKASDIKEGREGIYDRVVARIKAADKSILGVLSDREKLTSIIRDKEKRKEFFTYQKRETGRKTKGYDYAWKQALESMGIDETVYRKMALRKGSSAKSIREFEKHYKEIFEDLNETEFSLFNDMILHDRFVAIFNHWSAQVEGLHVGIKRERLKIDEYEAQETDIVTWIDLVKRELKGENIPEHMYKGLSVSFARTDKGLKIAQSYKKRLPRLKKAALNNIAKAEVKGAEIVKQIFEYRDTITDEHSGVRATNAPKSISIEHNWEAYVDRAKTRRSFVETSREVYVSERVSDEVGDKLDERATKYFDAQRSQLEKMWEAGLINRAAYEAMKDLDYTRLEYVGRVIEQFESIYGSEKMLSKSDKIHLERLKKGRGDDALVNSEFALNARIDQVDHAIAYNKTRKMVGTEIEKAVQGGLHENWAKIQNKGEKIPDGYTRFTWMTDKEKPMDWSEDTMIEIMSGYKDPFIHMAIQQAFDNRSIEGIERYIKKAGFDSLLKDDGTIESLWGGYEKGILVNNALAESFSHHGHEAGRWINASMNLLKTLATGRNARFAAINLLRDTFSMAWSTDVFDVGNGSTAGRLFNQNLPLVSFVNAMVKSGKEIRQWYKYKKGHEVDDIHALMESGMGFQGFVRAGVNRKNSNPYSDMVVTPDSQTKKPTVMSKFITNYKNALEGFEFATRIATAKITKERMIEQFKKEHGVEPEGDELEHINDMAAVAGREVMDFAKHGTAVKAIDAYVPYFNAAVQGTWAVVDRAKRDPRNIAGKSLGYIMNKFALDFYNSGEVFFALAEQTDDEETKEYYLGVANEMKYNWAQIHPTEKMSNVFIVLPFKVNQSLSEKGQLNGDLLTLRIPSPQQMFGLNFMTEQLYRSATGDEVMSERVLNELGTVASGTFMIPDATSQPLFGAVMRGYGYDPYYHQRTYDSRYKTYDPTKTNKIYGAMHHITGVRPEIYHGIVKSFIPESNAGVQLVMDLSDVILADYVLNEPQQSKNRLRSYTGLFQPTKSWSLELGVPYRDKRYGSIDKQRKIDIDNIVKANTLKYKSLRDTNVEEMMLELGKVLDNSNASSRDRVSSYNYLLRTVYNIQDPAASAIMWSVTPEAKAESIIYYRNKFGMDRLEKIIPNLVRAGVYNEDVYYYLDLMNTYNETSVEKALEKRKQK